MQLERCFITENVLHMGLIYHAALENSLIMCFMDSCLWNAPLPVFFRLVDASKMK